MHLHTKHLLTSILLLLLTGTLQAETIKIAVASNFHHTLQTITDAYHTAQPSRKQITLISASSGQLYHQIIQGAPFDIFFSATPDYVQALKQSDLTANNKQPLDFAIGQLALWAPKAETQAQVQRWLKSPDQHNHKLVVAHPTLAPFGLAAKQTLMHLNLEQYWQQRTVRAMNANQAYHYVFSGAASMGFTSLAHLKQNNISPQQYWTIPSDHHAPILQQGIILKRAQTNQNALDFFSFLKTHKSQNIIENAGYQLAHLHHTNQSPN